MFLNTKSGLELFACLFPIAFSLIKILGSGGGSGGPGGHPCSIHQFRSKSYHRKQKVTNQLCYKHANFTNTTLVGLDIPA